MTAPWIVLPSLKSQVGEGLTREPTEEYVVTCHVVESGGVKDGSAAYDGGVAGGEVAGILLNYGVVVIKGKGDGNAGGKQGGSEASDAAEGVNCSEARRQGWGRTDSDPDVGWSDVEETNTGG